MKLRVWLRGSLGLCAVVVLTLFTACASSYQVKVSAVGRENLAGQVTSYRMASRAHASPDDTLRFNELAGHIRTALSSKGLYEATSAQSADMIVEIDYGIAPPKTILEQGEQLILERPPRDVEDPGAVQPKQLMNYETVVRPVVVREKHLSVFARENKPAAPARELWRVQVSIEDSSRDLRGYLPLLASAMMDEIGRTSDGNTTKTLAADDPAIGFVKNGL